MKINREEVYNKCGGHCAYCGKEITIKQMQVDHIEPHWHTLSEQQAKKSGIDKGSHNISNLNPSCARCNKWKSRANLKFGVSRSNLSNDVSTTFLNCSKL